MTKEELKQEAEEWLRKFLLCNDCKRKCHCIELNAYCEEQVLKAYISSAEPREKRIAELDCQKNRNKFCYSCANATERCFRNEIGCPCDKYKSYKEENAELKGLKDVATLIRANNDTVVTLMQLNNKLVSKSQQLTKAKELLERLLITSCNSDVLNLLPNCSEVLRVRVEAEQFLKDCEVEK